MLFNVRRAVFQPERAGFSSLICFSNLGFQNEIWGILSLRVPSPQLFWEAQPFSLLQFIQSPVGEGPSHSPSCLNKCPDVVVPGVVTEEQVLRGSAASAAEVAQCPVKESNLFKKYHSNDCETILFQSTFTLIGMSCQETCCRH